MLLTAKVILRITGKTMGNNLLPKQITHITVPPVKCQGIKTKLVNFIASNISWQGNGRWIEPFLGSGVVAFNILAPRALLADTNPHIITLYQQIQKKKIDRNIVKDFLEFHGAQLEKGDGDYYYEIREQFNQTKDPLLFLFLNRASFNGLMRFNAQGNFNVPYNHKPNRFSKAYISKICNQVSTLQSILMCVDWEFIIAPWEQTIAKANADDFVYLDPPYIGRNSDYFNSWSYEDALKFPDKIHSLPCGYAMSMWLKNKYRTNEYIENFQAKDEILTFNHFYHIGSSESLRNSIMEALIIKPGYSNKQNFGNVKLYLQEEIAFDNMYDKNSQANLLSPRLYRSHR